MDEAQAAGCFRFPKIPGGRSARTDTMLGATAIALERGRFQRPCGGRVGVKVQPRKARKRVKGRFFWPRKSRETLYDSILFPCPSVFSVARLFIFQDGPRRPSQLALLRAGIAEFRVFETPARLAVHAADPFGGRLGLSAERKKPAGRGTRRAFRVSWTGGLALR